MYLKYLVIRLRLFISWLVTNFFSLLKSSHTCKASLSTVKIQLYIIFLIFELGEAFSPINFCRWFFQTREGKTDLHPIKNGLPVLLDPAHPSTCDENQAQPRGADKVLPHMFAHRLLTHSRIKSHFHNFSRFLFCFGNLQGIVVRGKRGRREEREILQHQIPQVTSRVCLASCPNRPTGQPSREQADSLKHSL